MVRVAGEIDLDTIEVLRDALADSLARGPTDVIVDLAAMTFCGVRGLTLLVQCRGIAVERGIGYAVAAASAQANRIWPALWPVAELPKQVPSAAAGVLAAMARQAGDDRTRWAPKRGPGWVRRWPTARPAGDAGGAERLGSPGLHAGPSERSVPGATPPPTYRAANVHRSALLGRTPSTAQTFLSGNGNARWSGTDLSECAGTSPPTARSGPGIPERRQHPPEPGRVLLPALVLPKHPPGCALCADSTRMKTGTAIARTRRARHRASVR